MYSFSSCQLYRWTVIGCHIQVPRGDWLLYRQALPTLTIQQDLTLLLCVHHYWNGIIKNLWMLRWDFKQLRNIICYWWRWREFNVNNQHFSWFSKIFIEFTECHKMRNRSNKLIYSWTPYYRNRIHYLDHSHYKFDHGRPTHNRMKNPFTFTYIVFSYNDTYPSFSFQPHYMFILPLIKNCKLICTYIIWIYQMFLILNVHIFTLY